MLSLRSLCVPTAALGNSVAGVAGDPSPALMTLYNVYVTYPTRQDTWELQLVCSGFFAGESQTAIISCSNERKSWVHLITFPITWRREERMIYYIWHITDPKVWERHLRRGLMTTLWGLIWRFLQSGTMFRIENMASTIIPCFRTWSGSQIQKFLLDFHSKITKCTCKYLFNVSLPAAWERKWPVDRL